jgi:protein phosphatase
MLDTSPRPRIVPVAHGRTDVGRQREHNEDKLLVQHELGLFVVCDGMGGNNAGEVASALATTSLENFFQATVDGSLPGKLRKEDESLSDSERRLVLGVRKANSDVYEISSTRIEHQGMGSTIVAMHVSGNTGSIEIAHIGDSRCYRIRDGKMEQLTRDHSLIGDALAWNPNLTEEELSRLPKNIISRALGLKRYVEVDVKTESGLPGDVYLLCSDGLSGMIKDAQIRDLVLLSDDLDEACENLIALANEAGGSDNITVVAVRIEADPSGETAEPVPLPSSQREPRAEAEVDQDARSLLELEPEPALEDDDTEPTSDPEPENEPEAESDSDTDEETDAESESTSEPPAIAMARAVDGETANGPDISVSSVAVDELLSYFDGAPGSDPTKKNGVAPTRCASCGGIPTPGDLFCGHCGARIPP